MTRLGLLAVLLLGCPAKKPGPELAQRVAGVVQKRIPEAKVTVVSPDALLVKVDDFETDLGLDYVRIACEDEAAECESAIEAAVAEVKRPPRVEKLDRQKILLTLKTEKALAADDARAKARAPDTFESNRLERTPFLADLVIVYLVDAPKTPHGIRMLTKGELAKNDLTLEAVDALEMEDQALSGVVLEWTPTGFREWSGKP